MTEYFKCSSIVIALILLSVGCVSNDIYNVKDAPVTTLSGNEPTLQQVGKAIVLAGVGLKWIMDAAGPGHLIGTLNLRTHQAVVDITYNTKAYSITYKNSTHLLIVDSEGNPSGIHRNYNSWIRNLDNAIRTQLMAIGT
jgi:hypothetical protein